MPAVLTVGAGTAGAEGATFLPFDQRFRRCDHSGNTHVGRRDTPVPPRGPRHRLRGDRRRADRDGHPEHALRREIDPVASLVGVGLQCRRSGRDRRCAPDRPRGSRQRDRSRPCCVGRDRRVDVHHSTGRVLADTGSRQIPRAGSQGRSRQATSCTGCANIVYERIRRKIHGSATPGVARIMLIH